MISNTNNLLKRINMNYDIKKWGEFDCRTTFNRFHQTAYSPLTDVIKNSVSEKDAFNSTLRQKALTLRTISNKAKESIQRSIQKKDFDSKYQINDSNYLNHNNSNGSLSGGENGEIEIYDIKLKKMQIILIYN